MKRFARCLAVLLVYTACSDPVGGNPRHTVLGRVDRIPAVSSAVRLTGRAEGADSARARVWVSGGAVATTPARPVTDSISLVVAGLLPKTHYWVALETFGALGVERSDSLEVVTDSLPTRLQNLHFTVTGTAPGGYWMFPVFLDSVGYLVAFDGAGSLRWYADLSPAMAGVSLGVVRQMASGSFVVYVGGTSGWNPVQGQFVEVALDGTMGRRHFAPPPLYLDNHDVRFEFGGDTVPDAIVYFGYDLRTTDMSAFGGSATARVAGHYLLRQEIGGPVTFSWSAWDHFSLADWIEEPLSLKTQDPIDFDHPNALTIDLDGNYLVSWRQFGQITKIDRNTSQIVWRLGGRANQFSFVNDPLGGFSGQHNIRVLPDGHLLLYDNGLRHAPPVSRAAEYAIDAAAKTATLVWEYRHTPSVYTPFTGSAERLTSGNTLIGWAGIGLVTEVTPAGTVVWEGQLAYKGQPVAMYRALRVPDLYRMVTP
jgi:hypothetical protein